VGSQRVDELEEQVAALRAQVDTLMRKLEEEKQAEPVVKGV
jgi:serine O-acetyltransferase